MAVQTRLVTSASTPGAPVDLVEVRQRLARVELPAVLGIDRRPVALVEQALGEVGGGHEVLESLLVLDADAGAAEVIGDAHGGDVHLALREDLALRSARSPGRCP